MSVPPVPFPLTLETGRLLLRPLEARDADALYTIFGDPQVMRYWSSPAWTSPAPAAALIASDGEGRAACAHARWGIVRRADDTLIGHCTLFNRDGVCRRAEIGYALAAAAQGQGCMHEALVALLADAWQRLDLNRIEADIDPRNTGSARTLERLGFRLEGLLRERWIVNGEVSDSAMYGLLRADALARDASG